MNEKHLPWGLYFCLIVLLIILFIAIGYFSHSNWVVVIFILVLIPLAPVAIVGLIVTQKSSPWFKRLKLSYVWSKGVILAFILGLIIGGVFGAVIAGVVEYFGPNESDWLKYSHGWLINIVVVGTILGGVGGAVQSALFAAIVALFNIGNRRSIILQITWPLESGIWVAVGIQEILGLQYFRGEQVHVGEFRLVWLLWVLLGIIAGLIGLRCATNKKDKGQEPLFQNPLHGLAVGLVIVPVLIAMIWTTVVTIMGW